MTHPDTKPEALHIADACEDSATVWAREIDTRRDAARELRRLHAECESLRTQLTDARQQVTDTVEARNLAIGLCREAQDMCSAARAEAEALRADARRWRKLSAAMTSSEPVEIQTPMPTALEAFMRIQAENKARADALIAQGKCPDCEGDGQMGGQFCGGYWTCEACNGSGTAMGAMREVE